MSVLQALVNMTYMTIAIFALFGAIDFIKESLVIFKKALRKRRERDNRKHR